ncbi:ureidoglycolate lyase [Chryseobacterium lactis]|uniref:FAA hydrolase family protein n=1 Tax=Chryseobacterium lactis TaxID=1241981 RepID=A0A3G6RLY5_CHRLC|nr:fumarylacetoacetate hydrolase family protein [Chryseobacterium lactis]AZA84900.1 FAA hydrolase family protein [Chryseobacterium lactis]AZB05288.1 FAA hydrolase family protein [Chryseobacterium lactis]PNW12271.1 ureidoglycolate lyase [Chryseobacterium lactis]
MKLIRYGAEGQEKPGVIIGEKYYDVSHLVNEYDEQFFSGNAIEELKQKIAEGNLQEINKDVRLGAPLARPSKIVCVGLNYKDHAAETNMPIPSEPILFFKATSAIVGPDDDVIIPKNSTKTDWEVELAIIIGKKASYVEPEDAFDHIAGYALHNDYSERAFQIERNGQWVKGKSADTFAPIGPFIATKDEIENVNNLKLWLKVNGTLMQNGNTSNFIFDVAYIVSYISQFMTLLPGDVISTGTPAGVGMGQKPKAWYLQPGDVVELGIEGLGTSKQNIKSYS